MNARQKKDFKKALKELEDARTVLGFLANELKNEFNKLENQGTKKAVRLESETAFCNKAAIAIYDIVKFTDVQ